MRLVWTTAGYAALVNDNNDGTNAVRVAHIAIGRGTRAAAASDTALVDEIKRVDTISGQAVDANIIHVILRDETADTYAASEIALIAADGTLLARYAQADAILEKATASTALLVIDATLTDVDATQITFGSLELTNPPWSETVQGVVQKATELIARNGVNKLRGMTPALTFASIKSYFNDATGPGHDNGLDADTVDGEHAPQLHDASALTGNVPAARLSGSYNISISGSAASAGNTAKLGNQAPAHYLNAGNMGAGTLPRARLPAATTQSIGAVERATDSEAKAGADDERYLTPALLKTVLAEAKRDFIDANNPVETVREFRNDSRNPKIILDLPGSTWARHGTGRVTVGEGYLYPYSYYAGLTGGEARVTLSSNQNGPHTHELDGNPIGGGSGGNNFHYDSGGNYLYFKSTQTKSSGFGQAHENRQPYIVLYRWVRTA